MLQPLPLLIAALVAVGLPGRAAADQHDPMGPEEVECRRLESFGDGPLSPECRRLLEAVRERRHERQRKAEARERERIIRESEEQERTYRELVEREAAKARAAARAKREAYIQAHPDIDPAYRQPLRDGRIMIGMPAHLVEVSWGKPKHINRTITGVGITEQWVYGAGDYVYIDNGRVRAIQTSR